MFIRQLYSVLMDEIYLKVTENGPYVVYGTPEIYKKIISADSITYNDGRKFEDVNTPVGLCRCGCSKNAPFCDNSHEKCDFDGKETASFELFFESAEKYSGARLTLFDNEKLCALAGFCDVRGSIWNLIFNDDDESAMEVIRQANMCPSGRLVVFDKNNVCLENSLRKSIAVLEDEGLNVSGPLWLQGGIRVESADGKSYEVRNKQTLCRCGKSKNKPFCDCTHYHINFNAHYQDNSQ